jgi:hypothetical protein
MPKKTKSKKTIVVKADDKKSLKIAKKAMKKHKDTIDKLK